MDYTCYILHIKKGHEDRGKSIIEQFSDLNMPFEWVLDHDIDDITPEILKKYKYYGTLSDANISLDLKHIYAWERIASGDNEGAFIFENDVLLDIQNFKALVQEALTEFHEQWEGRGYISLGNGCALYVPWTKIQKNKKLYPAEYVRATDSYWINRQTAQQMVQWVMEHGFGLPADHLIDKITSELDIPILWMEPTIATQGSHTGLFQSSIQDLKRGRFIDAVGWKMKIIRRKYIYPLLGKDLRKAD